MKIKGEFIFTELEKLCVCERGRKREMYGGREVCVCV